MVIYLNVALEFSGAFFLNLNHSNFVLRNGKPKHECMIRKFNIIFVNRVNVNKKKLYLCISDTKNRKIDNNEQK